MTTLTPWSDTVSKAIEYLSSADPVMAKAIAQVGPCTLVPDPNVFETLVDTIISQQISVKAADAIMARLRAAIPNALIAPEALMVLDHDALRAMGLSTPKARYVRDLTERVMSGQLNLLALDRLDDEEVIKQLVAVKGIGRWTAEMILFFAADSYVDSRIYYDMPLLLDWRLYLHGFSPSP